MANLLAALVCLTLVSALGLLLLARKQRERAGLPLNARIVYADTGAWEKVERPLFSRRYGLTGKPDYILLDKGAVIPVEVKPNRAASAPRESDIMQLAAYGLLLGESSGAWPAYGLLKYRDRVFQIDFNEVLKADLLALIQSLRHNLAAREVARSHGEPPRCQACGYRTKCGQAF